MRDRAAVARAVAGCDYVFHQAAIRITLCAEQPRDCMDVLVMGDAQKQVDAGRLHLVYRSPLDSFTIYEIP